ncbi:MAG: biotin-dependent carboxyltransferase family protein [Gammaproteobacteria bacterium]|nr:biotin-dependent carboxyltransferase family protein [Gammaproteobacteria bacterium]
MSGFIVKQPGLLTLIQDRGRFGAHHLGLTTGGPLDAMAFDWANRLLGNDENATCLEISFGGLSLEAEVDTAIVITGAKSVCKINGKQISQWQTCSIKKGDILETGFASEGVRSYLSVAGGFDIEPSFGSSSTVVREKIGGLHGDKLQAGDRLPCRPNSIGLQLRLADQDQPVYGRQATLRVVKGYQQAAFDPIQHWRFFNSTYQVTERSDRMGFRLEGEVIHSSMVGMLSEGICHGAIQIPADGQPIVLMNDRQTIGGYPKIGSVIPLDTARLAQLTPGSGVRFEAISIEQAHNLHWLEKSRYQRTQPVKV